MSVYHVEVTEEDGWYIGRVLDRPGVVTQGKSLDEMVFMLRDAIAAMWDETSPQLEISIRPDVAVVEGVRDDVHWGKLDESEVEAAHQT